MQVEEYCYALEESKVEEIKVMQGNRQDYYPDVTKSVPVFRQNLIDIYEQGKLRQYNQNFENYELIEEDNQNVYF
jgi:hypothetical protein